MSKDYYLEISEGKSLILPSELEKRKKKSSIKPKNLKWPLIILFIVLIYLFYNQIMFYFFEFLKLNPTFYSKYLYIESQISNSTLEGLFYVAVMGSIFFLVLPSEALFIFYLGSTDHFFIVIIILMIIGNLLGMLFNYWFGRLLGERVLQWFFGKKKFFDYKEKIDKVGGYILLFGNILPGPIEVLAVFYGGFKFKFSTFLFLTFIGRLVKYIIIFLLFYFYWDQIVWYYHGFIDNYGILKDLYLSQ